MSVYPTDEPPPTLGVREPRRPRPFTPTTSATAAPEWELAPPLEAVPPGACVVSATRGAEES